MNSNKGARLTFQINGRSFFSIWVSQYLACGLTLIFASPLEFQCFALAIQAVVLAVAAVVLVVLVVVAWWRWW